MAGETNLAQMIKGMQPKLNVGELVFVSVNNLNGIDRASTSTAKADKAIQVLKRCRRIINEQKLKIIALRYRSSTA